MESLGTNGWKKCSACKKTIDFGATYYLCSVSTCNGQRTGYVFCSVACFETHLPGARHRDAGAVEKKAPAKLMAKPAGTGTVGTASTSSSSSSGGLPRETLIIASRFKDYIQAKAGMNTSAAVVDILSDFVRRLADEAIDNARADGRKTVLDRDLEFLKTLK